jgi:hypothetical protein
MWDNFCWKSVYVIQSDTSLRDRLLHIQVSLFRSWEMNHQVHNAGHKRSHLKCSLNEIHVDNYRINISTLLNGKFLCQHVLGALLENTMVQTTTSSFIVKQLQGLSFCCFTWTIQCKFLVYIDRCWCLGMKEWQQCQQKGIFGENSTS